MRLLLGLCLLLSILGAHAQNLPLGSWQVHVPYTSSVDLVVAGDKVWGALEASVIAVDREDLSITRYTKANGLSDVEVAAIAYDDVTDAVIIAYSNANIDIVRGNSLVNVPDLKNASITGDKSVNAIYTHDGYAWLATGFAIVVVNIEDAEIADTYMIGPGNANLRVNDVWVNDDYVFAATADGILRGTISPLVNLSNADDPNAWLRYTFEEHMIPEDDASAIDVLNGDVYAFIGDEIFTVPIEGLTWTPVANTSNFETVGTRTRDGVLYLAQHEIIAGNITGSRIGAFDGIAFDFIEDNGQVQQPSNIDADEDGTIWYSEFLAGLTSVSGSSFNRFVPNGPYKRTVMGMAWFDGSMYVASSSMSYTLPGTNPLLPYGFYRSTDQLWNNFNYFNVPDLSGMDDIAVIEPIPGENKLLIGAHDNGIIEFGLDDNSVKLFESVPGENDPYRTIAMTSDEAGNIWFPNAFASAAPLVCRKPGGEYIYFTEKTATFLNRPINGITIDEFNQIWMSTAGSGVYVYNYGGTLEDQSDDNVKFVGSGFNLPAVDVRCIATDQDGEVWIGTTAGIGVVFCPGAIFNNACIVDRICIPREDTTNFCDNLLENELINCITIDPGNRKWIGTNSGVFLQSADGLQTIRHFTVDNSPLLSNIIRSVAINEENGDVYIGTELGINTFRGDATVTDEKSGDRPYVYPNPVRPDYRGPIAIRNLPNNANVKIVDTAGFLVYETTSEGGTATWDGRDVHGKRVHSGVYIVLSADEDGKFKRTAKFVFIK
jgi:hypothetical protein